MKCFPARSTWVHGWCTRASNFAPSEYRDVYIENWCGKNLVFKLKSSKLLPGGCAQDDADMEIYFWKIWIIPIVFYIQLISFHQHVSNEALGLKSCLTKILGLDYIPPLPLCCSSVPVNICFQLAGVRWDVWQGSAVQELVVNWRDFNIPFLRRWASFKATPDVSNCREAQRKFLLQMIASIEKEEVCFTKIRNLSLGFPLKQNYFALVLLLISLV